MDHQTSINQLFTIRPFVSGISYTLGTQGRSAKLLPLCSLIRFVRRPFSRTLTTSSRVSTSCTLLRINSTHPTMGRLGRFVISSVLTHILLRLHQYAPHWSPYLGLMELFKRDQKYYPYRGLSSIMIRSLRWRLKMKSS